MLQSIFGLICFIGIGWLLSEHRWQVQWQRVIFGVGIQIGLAALLFNFQFLQDMFMWLNHIVLSLDTATSAGTAFVFGYLGGADLPFKTTAAGSHFVLAFKALPILLVMSALSALLFYWQIMPWVVRGFAWGLQKTLGIGGALGVGAAANIFIGMTEAPLFIRPYLDKLTRSELFALMSVGMATIAGTMLVIYASILGTVFPNALGHLLFASILSAPAAITITQLMIPETQTPTAGQIQPISNAHSSIDAVTQGSLEGLQLLLNMVALLIVFVALVHLSNQLLNFLPAFADQPLTLQRILGWIMSPIVWLMGIPWAEAQIAGSLMGIKTILNEFIAYIQLAQESELSERSRLIMIYALCGFANFGSLGIMIGGLGTLVPQRRTEIAELGIKAIIAGTLATCMTGTVVGLFYF